jgi:hypothetical protein
MFSPSSRVNAGSERFAMDKGLESKDYFKN